jgi:hypothetical protein
MLDNDQAKVEIASGDSEPAEPFDAGGNRLFGFDVPALDGTTERIYFKTASSRNGTPKELIDGTGTAVFLTIPAGGDCNISPDDIAAELAPWRWIWPVLATAAGAADAQSADRTIHVVMKG